MINRVRSIRVLASLSLLLIGLRPSTAVGAEVGTAPLKVLFVSGGGWHDYEKQVPYITAQLTQLLNLTIVAQTGLEGLRDPKFADPYDAVVYDVCFDDAPEAILDNALAATRLGKPAVMIHCSVHAFRRSPKVHEWETCCGMRSKVHDAYGPFTVTRQDPANPVTKQFPAEWKTPGDELYQTISIEPESRQLLKAKSPQDGREHLVCWTYDFGKGRVFSTTLGHDMKTITSPHYIRLLANGLLWTCGKLDSEGKAAAGYGRAAAN